jgi:FkbM family methyltransferase
MHRPIEGDIWLRELGSDSTTFLEVVVLQVYGVITERLKTCEYVIDLGANIGLASRYFACTYPQCRIFAVEPDASNFAQLTRNLRPLLRSGRCVLERAAVWESNSILAVAPAPGGDGFDAIRVSRTESLGTEQSATRTKQCVTGISMNEVLARSGFPYADLLKVDIEGAEVELFRGDLTWLGRTNAIAIEFHQDSRRESRFDSIMEEHGFDIDDSHRHTVLAIRQSMAPKSERAAKQVAEVNGIRNL